HRLTTYRYLEREGPELLNGFVCEVYSMLGARGDRVSASRRKLTQALEQDRLLSSPQGSSSSRSESKETGGTGRNTQHGSRRSLSREEDESEEELRDRRRLIASPPTETRPLGVRPFSGRSPSRSGTRGEMRRQPNTKGSLTSPEKREGMRRASGDGLGDGEYMLPHACSRRNVRNTLGEADDSGGPTSRRGTTSAIGQDDEKNLPADSHATAVLLEGALRNQENSRDGQNSRKGSVRIIAEDFIGNVLNDLASSPSHRDGQCYM
ncbi:unnamed protein product, partial [Ectocarpus sp. 4 AP-2014]